MLFKNTYPLNEDVVDEGTQEELVDESLEDDEEEPQEPEEEVDIEGFLSKHGDKVNQHLRRKIKINGEEVEVSLDDLERNYSKGMAADHRFREAADKAKKAEELMEQASKMSEMDLAELIRSRGITDMEGLENALTDIMMKFQEEEELTPAEKEKRRLQKELDAYKEREKAEKEEREKSERQKAEDAEYAKLEKEFYSAMEKSDLPKNPYILTLVANEVADNEDIGYNIPVSEAVENVKEQLKAEFLPSLLASMTPAQKRALIGEDLLKSLNEEAISEVQEKRRPPVQPSRSRPRSKSPNDSDNGSKAESKRTMNTKEWMQSLLRS